MITNIKKQSGVTLLEVILVLVIASAVLYLSFLQYHTLRNESNEQQLLANVDTIFQGMGYYYKANCFGTYDTATNSTVPGTLNPAFSPTPPDKRAINIQTELVNAGYISKGLSTVVPINPIVNSSGPGTKGYVAQFNQSTMTRYICTDTTSSATGPTPQQGCTQSSTSPVAIGTIIIWRAQVAILLAKPDDANTYKAVLNADCTSSAAGSPLGTIVLPCANNSPGPYLVWERLPSLTVPSNVSNYWETNHQVAAFKEMYTTEPINYLTTVTPPSDKQYFLCGG